MPEIKSGKPVWASIWVLTVLLIGAQMFEPADAQGALRSRLRQRLMQSSQGQSGDSSSRDGMRQHFIETNQDRTGKSKKETIAGLQVAIWSPENSEGPAPLVIFSHGFHGMNTQSVAIMQALAKAGYLVIAPNHRDAMGGGNSFSRAEVGFGKAKQWTDKTYADRGADISNLLQALHNDPNWSSRVDWSKVALAGHSLGGYTALGAGGAWPSWKLPEVKAVLALSPYCQPYVENGNLDHLDVPVMYQSGTFDMGIDPFIKRSGGAFDKSSSPAYFVEVSKAGHLAWSNFNKNKQTEDIINYYSVAFLDKFVKGDPKAAPEQKLPGVTDLRVK